jgi:hypothetical protein
VTETLVVGVLNSIENDIPWIDVIWGVRWWDVLNVSSYQIKVYDNSGMSPVLKRTTDQLTREFVYDYTMAVIDGNLVRDMIVSVDAEFEEGLDGDPVELDLTNAIPSPPTGLGSSEQSVESDQVNYTLSWTVPAEEDLIRVKVWVSEVDGFDPSVDVPVYDFTAGSPGSAGIPTSTVVSIPLDSSDGHAIQYWRVGLFDVWGSEISTNVSAQQVIAAYP